MIIHWAELRRCCKQLLAWTLFIIIVAPFLLLFGAVAFAIGASQAEHYLGTNASEAVGIVFASIVGVATLRALVWWTTRLSPNRRLMWW
jgi:hypothetical protein